MIKAYRGTCIGVIITGYSYTGEIIKTNKKSIRVHLNHFTKTEGEKVVIDRECNITETFTFWKNREDNGNAIYKNQLYGKIELTK